MLANMGSGRGRLHGHSTARRAPPRVAGSAGARADVGHRRCAGSPTSGPRATAAQGDNATCPTTARRRRSPDRTDSAHQDAAMNLDASTPCAVAPPLASAAEVLDSQPLVSAARRARSRPPRGAGTASSEHRQERPRPSAIATSPRPAAPSARSPRLRHGSAIVTRQGVESSARREDALGQRAATSRARARGRRRGRLHALEPAEMREQRLPLARADAVDFLQRRRRPRLGAARTVALDREAVRLVADLLQQVQPRVVRRQAQRLRPARETRSPPRPPCARGPWRCRSAPSMQPLLRQHLRGHGDLAPAAVDHQQVRRRDTRRPRSARSGATAPRASRRSRRRRPPA